jgi:hypothetical protein
MGIGGGISNDHHLKHFPNQNTGVIPEHQQNNLTSGGFNYPFSPPENSF